MTGLPDIGHASEEDLQLAVAAVGGFNAVFGGFIRAALAGIYAERARAAENNEPYAKPLPRPTPEPLASAIRNATWTRLDETMPHDPGDV